VGPALAVRGERPDPPEHLSRVRLTDFDIAVRLVAILPRAEEDAVVDAEVAPEVIVVAADVQMLPREVEVGQATAAGLDAAAPRRVREGPVAVPPRAVLIPADVVIDAAGERVVGFL